MENYSNHSYPDSRDSSPRSREIDCDTPSWDDQPPLPSSSSAAAAKVKLMCSYGGKIQPRPHDNQLAYVGGDTKILAVDRSIKLSAFVSRLSSLCDGADQVCFKYQLPGEDLDALISVTNDEDLEHMMIEYDRLYRASPAKPARLRLFLFPLNPNSATSFGSNDSKSSDRQWFVDALNSVQIQSPEGSSPTAPPSAASTNPDFLFGLDKGFTPAKLPDASVTPPPPSAPDLLLKNSELNAPPAISQLEIQRQMSELQRMQFAAAGPEPPQPTIYQRKSDVELPNPRGDYYYQKLPENMASTTPVPMPAHMQYPTSYMPERQMAGGNYQVAPGGGEQPVYLISTPGGVYQAPVAAHRPVTGPVGQAYYGMPQQRMVPEVYRDVQAQAYNTAVAAQQQQQAQQHQQQQQAKIAAYSEGFAQVGYDNAGRQVYYTTAGGAPVASSYQTVAPVPVPVDARQGVGAGAGAGGALSQIQDGAK